MKAVKAVLLIVSLIIALAGGYLLGSRHPAGHDDAPAPQTAKGQMVDRQVKQQYTCSMHPFIIRDAPGVCPICGMTLTPVKSGDGGQQPAAVRKWRSPMDPSYVREAPGKDYMGHDLVPVEEGGGDSRTISIDPVTAQNMGVRTEPVARRSLVKVVRTVGLVTYEEDRQFSVNSKIDGWIEKLHVNQEGQMVEKGQPLLEIYSPDLVAAQQEYLLALQNSRRLAASPVAEVGRSAARLLEAARTRLQYWDITPGQIRAIERSGQPSKTLTLFSPQAGVVTMKKALAGMRIMAGEELLQIADISRIWVNAEIYEYELPWVKVGQKARVELPFAGGKTFDGEITYILPYLKNETRTARARIELANPGLKLKPDMYADVSIEAGSVENALAIPASAILSSGKGQTVFVARGGGKYEPRPVKSGIADDGGYVQVLSGLDAGESVVVSAQFMLDSESTLREALQKMTAPAATASGTGLGTEAGRGTGGQSNDPAEHDGTKKLDDLFK